MGTELVKHIKVIDELDNTIEVKMWQLPEPTKDRPHGYKYSLVYIVDGERIIGYDNAERKGDHRHIKNKTELYSFISLNKTAADFYKDIERYKRGEL